MQKNAKAIIIGSGVGGLATAIRLACKGYTVDVFEKNGYPGGKLSEFWLGDYRFDAGPSLFTLPELVKELYDEAGEDFTEFVYHPLEVICKYFYEDGTVLHAWADLDKFAAEVESQTGEPAERIRQFLATSKKRYDLTADIFIFNAFYKISTLFSKRFLTRIPKLAALNVFETMHEENARFFRDKRVVQLFNRYATYNGSSPYKAPATLNVIPNLEYNHGAFLPQHGMIQITNALVDLARKKGVTIHYNTQVTEILVQNQKAVGIKTAQNQYDADWVISDSDVHHTYHKLLPNLPKPIKTLAQERSSSALVFNWGIAKKFPELDVHNIFFSADYEEEFEALFERYMPGADPTVYVFISSKKVPGDAPPHGENWFTMINAPQNNGQDWDALIPVLRQTIIQKLERILKTDIQAHIESEWVLDPRGIEIRTASFGGSLYGTSSNNKFAAFKRHANQHAHIKNLYFVGGSVHPGGGIPLCLSSAKITAQFFPALTT